MSEAAPIDRAWRLFGDGMAKAARDLLEREVLSDFRIRTNTQHHAEVLDLLVDCCEVVNDIDAAIRHQKHLVSLEEKNWGSISKGAAAAHKRLADLYLKQITQLNSRERIIEQRPHYHQATQTYQRSYDIYAEIDAPWRLNAISCQYGLFLTAYVSGDRVAMMDWAKALIKATRNCPDKSKDRKKIGQFLMEAAACCNEYQLCQPTEVLSVRACELLDRPSTTPQVELAAGQPRFECLNRDDLRSTISAPLLSKFAFRLEIQNTGGSCRGIGIRLSGDALEQGQVAPIEVHVEAPVESQNICRRLRSENSGSRSMDIELEMSVGAAVKNELELRALKSDELEGELEKSLFAVFVKVRPCSTGLGSIRCRVFPIDHPKNGIGIIINTHISSSLTRDPLKRAATSHKQKSALPAWQVRCAQIIEALERAVQDVEFKLDLPQLIGQMPIDAQRYIKLIVDTGAVYDEHAIERLSVSESQFKRVLAEIDVFLEVIEQYRDSSPMDSWIPNPPDQSEPDRAEESLD